MSSFCKSYSHFFSKNISVYAIFNDQNFNDTLTNDIVSFEQLGGVRFPAHQGPSENESILKERICSHETGSILKGKNLGAIFFLK